MKYSGLQGLILDFELHYNNVYIVVPKCTQNGQNSWHI